MRAIAGSRPLTKVEEETAFRPDEFGPDAGWQVYLQSPQMDSDDLSWLKVAFLERAEAVELARIIQTECLDVMISQDLQSAVDRACNSVRARSSAGKPLAE